MLQKADLSPDLGIKIPPNLCSADIRYLLSEATIAAITSGFPSLHSPNSCKFNNIDNFRKITYRTLIEAKCLPDIAKAEVIGRLIQEWKRYESSPEALQPGSKVSIKIEHFSNVSNLSFEIRASVAAVDINKKLVTADVSSDAGLVLMRIVVPLSLCTQIKS